MKNAVDMFTVLFVCVLVLLTLELVRYFNHDLALVSASFTCGILVMKLIRKGKSDE